MAASSLLLFLAAALAAADGEKPRAFRARRIITLEGAPVEGGALLVRGGKVERVLAAGDAVPPGAEVIELGEAVVMPGLVNPLSQLVTSSSSSRRRPGAASGGAGGAVDARHFRAAESFAPQSPALRRLGRTGYAAVAVSPAGGGFLAGIAAVARARADEAREKVIIQPAAYLSMGYGLGTPMRELAERELGEAVARFKKGREEREKAKAKPAEGESKAEGEKQDAAGKAESGAKAERRPEKPAPPDPLAQVLAGELTAFLKIESAAALDHLFRVLDRLGEPFPFVLVTPPLERQQVEKVARRKSIRAVVLEPRTASLTDSSIQFCAARLFHEAGLEVALVPSRDDLEGHGEMLFSLSEMVKAGLPEEAALRAATAVPASLLKISERLGSLAPGRDASFAALDGEPLSGRARLLRVLVEGEEVYRDDPATGRIEGESVR